MYSRYVEPVGGAERPGTAVLSEASNVGFAAIHAVIVGVLEHVATTYSAAICPPLVAVCVKRAGALQPETGAGIVVATTLHVKPVGHGVTGGGAGGGLPIGQPSGRTPSG
jgi:hypothetical protein